MSWRVIAVRDKKYQNISWDMGIKQTIKNVIVNLTPSIPCNGLLFRQLVAKPHQEVAD